MNSFYADELKDYGYIIPVVYDIAVKNLKEAIKFITNNSSIRFILLNKQKQKFNVVKEPVITLKQRDENYFYKHVL